MKPKEYNQMDDYFTSKLIVDVFEDRGWGLYKREDEYTDNSLEEMVKVGRVGLVELNTIYVPLPLDDSKNIEVMKGLIQFGINNNRFPFYFDIYDIDSTSGEVVVNGVYPIDSILNDEENLNLIIDKNLLLSLGLEKELSKVSFLKNPNIYIPREKIYLLPPQLYKSSNF